MKITKHFILITLVLSVMLQSGYQALAQKYRKKEVALISFKLYIDPGYAAKFSEYAHLFREPVKPGVNKVESHLTSDIWDMLKQKLSDDVGMIIIPIDAYGNKFSYDQYGFPDVSINLALQRGNSKYYIKVDVEITPEFSSKYVTKTSSDSSPQIIHLASNEIKPKILFKMSIFNDKGIIPVANCKGEAIAQKIITVNEKFFDGFINPLVGSQQETLYKLVDQALKDLIISVYSNK